MLGLGTLQRVVNEIRADVASARDRDPAARSVGTAEILMNWGGVQAVLSHRVAHALHEGSSVAKGPLFTGSSSRR